MERRLVKETGCSWMLAHQAIGEAKDSGMDTADDEKLIAAAKAIITPKLEKDKAVAKRRTSPSEPDSPEKDPYGYSKKDKKPAQDVQVEDDRSQVSGLSTDISAAPSNDWDNPGGTKKSSARVLSDNDSQRSRGSLSRSSSRRGSYTKRSLERELVQNTGSSWRLAHEAVEQAKASDIDVTDDEAVLAKSREIINPKLDDDKEIAARRPSSKSNRKLGATAAAVGAGAATGAAVGAAMDKETDYIPDSMKGGSKNMVSYTITSTKGFDDDSELSDASSRASGRRYSVTKNEGLSDSDSQRSRGSLSRSSSRRGSASRRRSLERELVQQTGSSWSLAHEAVEQAKESDIDITDDEAVLSEAKGIMSPKLEDDKEIAARRPSSKSNRNLGATAAAVGAGAAAGAAVGVGAAAIASNTGSSAAKAPVVVASSVDSSPKPAAPVVASSVDSSPKPALPVVAPVTRSVPRRGSESSQLSRSSSRRGRTSKRSLERELVQQTGSSWSLAHEAVEQAKESDIDITDDEAVLSEAKGIMSPKLEDDKEIAARRPSSKSNRNLGATAAAVGAGAAAGAAVGAGAAAIASNTGTSAAKAPVVVPVTRSSSRRGSGGLSRSGSRRGSVRNLEREIVQETGSSWRLAHEAVEGARASDIDVTDDEAVLSEAKSYIAPKLDEDKARRTARTSGDPMRSGFRSGPEDQDLSQMGTLTEDEHELFLDSTNDKVDISAGAVAAGVGAGAAAGLGAAAIAGSRDAAPKEGKDTAAFLARTFEIPSDVSGWLEDNFRRDDISMIVLSAASGRPLSRFMRPSKPKSSSKRSRRRPKPKSNEKTEIALLRSELHLMRNEMHEVLKRSEATTTEPLTTEPESP